MKYYSTKETCEILGIGRDKLRSLRRAGAIGWVNTGNGYRYAEEWIKECMERYKYADLGNDKKILTAVAITKGKTQRFCH